MLGTGGRGGIGQAIAAANDRVSARKQREPDAPHPNATKPAYEACLQCVSRVSASSTSETAPHAKSSENALW